jgi:hypothetical protein
MTEECITPLRRRMIEDMSVRHFASKTQHDYIRTVGDPLIPSTRAADDVDDRMTGTSTSTPTTV